MKVVGIGGVPGSGKSQLVQALLQTLPPPRPFSWNSVKGEIRGRVLVLGVYDGKPYPGTDRLSMGVQPDAIRLLTKLRGADVVLFEGARLFRQAFLRAALDACPGSRFFLLDATPRVLAERRMARRDAKGEVYIKGLETMYRNLASAFGPPDLRVLKSETVADLERNAAEVGEFLRLAGS